MGMINKFNSFFIFDELFDELLVLEVHVVVFVLV
jgi:hypothetical protein